jgi:transposase InsO family protein
MTPDEDRRALQRFVAGLEVEADALATAIAAEAMDRAIVDEALLRGLSSDDAVVRRRTARRIARMTDVGDAVAGRLAIIAETDADERTRETAAAALQAQNRLPDAGLRGERRRRRVLAALRFVPATVRSTGPVRYQPLEPPAGSRIVDARLLLVDDAVHLRLRELPAEFAGTFPVAAAIDDDTGAERELGRASTAVSPAGDVTIALAPELGSLESVAARLKTFDLFVLRP